MISKARRVKINDWLFSSLWMARHPGSKYHSFVLEQVDFAPIVTQRIDPRLANLVAYATQYSATGMQLLDWLRATVIFCPCQSTEDWDYTIQLMQLHYVKPYVKTSGIATRISNDPDKFRLVNLQEHS